MPLGLKQRLQSGIAVVGASLRFGSAAVAELFSRAGFDWLLIDSEHAPQTPPGIQTQLQGIACGGASGIVRVSANDPDLMRVYLDMGAEGIVAPFVNTAEEASRGERACRYPPQGTRGFGPSRAAGYGLYRDYFSRANAEVAYIPIIESATALQNIDAILAVDGVDSFILGLADLSISLGVPLELNHARVQDAIRLCAGAAHRAGKPAGIGVQGDPFESTTWKRHAEAGYRLLLFGGDEWLLADGCRRILQAARIS